MFLISRIVILLNEAKIFLPLPLQGQLPPLGVGWEIALWTGQLVRWGQMLVGGILNFYFSLSSDLETIREMENCHENKGGSHFGFGHHVCLPSSSETQMWADEPRQRSQDYFLL